MTTTISILKANELYFIQALYYTGIISTLVIVFKGLNVLFFKKYGKLELVKKNREKKFYYVFFSILFLLSMFAGMQYTVDLIGISVYVYLTFKILNIIIKPFILIVMSIV